MTVMVGGVGQLYQGDLDAGRLVVEQLGDMGPGVVVEDLHYGAVAVSQRLEELGPDTLILVGAEARGLSPGTLTRRLADTGPIDSVQAQDSVEGAIIGYVTIDLILDVIRALGTAPERVVVFEIEPERIAPDPRLTPTAETAVGRAVEAVRREVGRAPLFLAAERLRREAADVRAEESPAAATLALLLNELRRVEDGASWGRTFPLRDRLRNQISGGGTGEGMSHLDWGLWWALLEELDRLQRMETV